MCACLCVQVGAGEAVRGQKQGWAHLCLPRLLLLVDFPPVGHLSHRCFLGSRFALGGSAGFGPCCRIRHQPSPPSGCIASCTCRNVSWCNTCPAPTPRSLPRPFGPCPQLFLRHPRVAVPGACEWRACPHGNRGGARARVCVCVCVCVCVVAAGGVCVCGWGHRASRIRRTPLARHGRSWAIFLAVDHVCRLSRFAGSCHKITGCFPPSWWLERAVAVAPPCTSLVSQGDAHAGLARAVSCRPRPAALWTAARASTQYRRQRVAWACHNPYRRRDCRRR